MLNLDNHNYKIVKNHYRMVVNCLKDCIFRKKF